MLLYCSLFGSFYLPCDTDAEGTKYGVNGVEAAFASTK